MREAILTVRFHGISHRQSFPSSDKPVRVAQILITTDLFDFIAVDVEDHGRIFEWSKDNSPLDDP